MKKYVSIDIGGTAIKYGIINEAGQVLHNNQMSTEAYKGGPEIVNKIIDIVEKCQIEEEIYGICIATAGMVDVQNGKILFALPDIIPNYSGTCLKEILENQFHIPCEVENDVNCIGLAESISGAAKGKKNVLALAVGTGIGGCAVIDGKIYHGFSGSACEIGYMHIDDSDLQSAGSTSALIKKVASWKEESVFLWNGYRVFEEAKKGDSLCVKAIDEMVDALGKGIANLCYVLNPETVVLGGGIMAEGEYLKKKLEAAVERWLIPAIASKTTVAFAKHQNNAGMLGAFYHFRQRQGME